MHLPSLNLFPALSCTLTLAALLSPLALRAESPEEIKAQVEALEHSLHYQTGDVAVGNNLATLHLDPSLHFLGPDDARKVLVAWGNPAEEPPLGMITRSDASPFADDSWAVVVTYSEDGYVDDAEAKNLDYSAILREMQKDAEAENEERVKAGYAAVRIVGWAEPPHYDASSNKLYWAKELDFGSDEHTLNYSIRALGRKGVLELNAVASMSQLETIRQAMPQVLKEVEFNAGSRYQDFTPGVDQVASYGIGALVAGKVAAKAGLLKGLLAILIAGKKVVIGGAAGLAMWLKQRLGSSDDSRTT